ncbi:hypothetical protein PybrP1_011080 [[Pythium] brassicae (nom. inval.)]|nr:hypothetical protein PybrP1_011080 [[Pythium] brassicae (nom. inval.)]
MRFTLPPGTFPPLNLSAEEAESITQTAQRLVDESISEFNDMIANNRKLPGKLWKFVTARENLRVYRTRSSYDYASDVGSSSAWTPQMPHLLSASVYREQELARARKAAALHNSPAVGEGDSDYASSSSGSDVALFAERLDSEAPMDERLRGGAAQALAAATHCHACTKSFIGLNGLLRSPRVCQCCRRVVCRKKCSVNVRLAVDISASAVTHRKMPFCLQCMLQAKRLSALEVATLSAPDDAASYGSSSRVFATSAARSGGGGPTGAGAVPQYMLL